MRIELEGRRAAIAGVRHALAEAAAAALAENGATIAFGAPDGEVDLLLLAHPLDLDPRYRPEQLIELADRVAAAMIAGRGGRILHLLPAAAALPMRRHAEASRALAEVVAAVRGLAMQAGPTVLVNALAIGWLEPGPGDPDRDPDLDPALDPGIASHVPLARPARIEEAVAALLFLADPLNSYTTGQVLAVDGGFMAGYGRDF